MRRHALVLRRQASGPIHRLGKRRKASYAKTCLHVFISEPRMFLQAADNTSPSAYLAVQPFEDVVRPDIAPVLTGELEVRQRFANTPRFCRTPSGSGC